MWIENFGGVWLGVGSAGLRSLFLNSEPGFTFEPWDRTTLYQDRAGTTPVTAAGQSVGLRLSKDQGLRQGPELVTNGSFDVDLTDWTTGSAITSSVVSGEAQITFGGSAALSPNNWFSQAGKLPSTTASYKVTFDATWVSGGALQLASGYDIQATISANAGKTTYTAIIKRGTSGTPTDQQALVFAGAAATVWKIDNISVRELAGNHQVAVSDAKRGVYGWMPKTGRRNLLTYTEQFDNAVWSKINVSVSSDVVSSPIGSPTADKLIASVANAQHRTEQNTSVIAGNTYTFSVYAKAGECSGIQMRCAGDVAQTFFDLTAGTIIEISNGQASISSAGNGWYLCSVKGVAVTTGSAVNRLNILLSGKTNAWTGDGTSGIYIWGAQLELGSTATAYQRVVSQYDITEAGVPTCYYVQADGVDDAYVTPTITPNTDKVQVFAGVRKLSDAAIGMPISFSADAQSNNGSFALFTATLSGAEKYNFFSRGTIGVWNSTSSSLYSAPVTNVIGCIADISSDISILRVNGVQAAQSTADQGTGNFLAYPAYIYSRAGTSLPFNGLDFGHAVRFGPNLDAATIARVEALIARNTPEVTL